MDTALLGDLERIKEHHFVEKVQMLKKLQESYGDAVIDTAMRALEDSVREEWHTIGELHGRNDIQELVHVVWEHFGKSGGFEFQVDSQPEGVQITCTKCPWPTWPAPSASRSGATASTAPLTPSWWRPSTLRSACGVPKP